LLSSFHVTETDSILVRLPFRLGPADIGYPLSEKSDYERVFALSSLSESTAKNCEILFVYLSQAA